MPDLFAFSAASVWAFLQIFARVTALLVTAPVFGSPQIPPQVKIACPACSRWSCCPSSGGR